MQHIHFSYLYRFMALRKEMSMKTFLNEDFEEVANDKDEEGIQD